MLANFKIPTLYDDMKLVIWKKYFVCQILYRSVDRPVKNGVFDGKLFQHKLAIASRAGANLLNICNEDRNILPVLDSLRAAILEGTQTTRAHLKK